MPYFLSASGRSRDSATVALIPEGRIEHNNIT
jgi:hypothetical protein